MNWLDIVIIVIILISTLRGLKDGLIKTVLSLAGLIVGVILAGRYRAALAERLTFIPQSSLANIAAFAIILVVVILAASIVAAVLKWTVSMVMLGWLNHLGGVAFGFVTGAIFCGALLAVWVKFMGTQGPVAGSALAPLLLDRFPMILALLPKEFDRIRSFFK